MMTRTRFLKIPLAVIMALVLVSSGCAAGGSEERTNNSTAGEDRGLDSGQPNAGDTGARSTVDTTPAGGSGARSLQEDFRRVAAAVLPVVVEINVVQVVTRSSNNPLDRLFGNPDGGQEEFQRPGLGSGVIIDRDGDTIFVVTNEHVVRNAEQIQVVLHDGREFQAELVGTDTRTDLAAVRFTSSDDIPIAEFGNSQELRVGDLVLAVGNPFGFESTVTAGIVSAVNRRPEPGTPITSYTDFVQTDAAINPGNSGGALVDLDGRVVGINSWIASRSGASAGIGFAVPTGTARRVVNDLIEDGRVTYGWLGVGIQDVTEAVMPSVRESLNLGDATGALVINVHSDSPAEGTLQPGDFVTHVGGANIQDSTALTRAVGEVSPGTAISFRFLRFGEQMSAEVTLEERAPETQLQQVSDLWPGAMAVNLTDNLRNQLGVPGGTDGVLLVGVVAQAPFASAGLQNGDLVVSIDGENVTDVADFYRAVNTDSFRLTMTVFRAGSQGQVTVQKP